MTSEWTPIDTAETVLLVLGSVLLLFGVVRLSTRGTWRETLSLPPPDSFRIEPLDPAIAFFAMFFVPQLLYAVILGTGPRDESPTTTQPLPQQGQIVVAFFGQLLACGVILALGAYRNAWQLRAWGLSTVAFARTAVQAIVGYICVWPLCFGLLHLTVFIITRLSPSYSPPEHQTIRILLSGEAGPLAAALTVVSAIILAPINEELLFRGMLQPVLAGHFRSSRTAIIICAVAFGLFHYPLVHTMPALALFGLVLGYLRAKSGSLMLVILVHVIFNAKTLLWLALGAK